MNTIIDNIDLWTSARTPKTAGRGNKAGNQNLTGIQKLRELILELAVHGKLVPQDPQDDPASELLKKVAEEKEKLIRERKIRRPKLLPEIVDEEIPFELPKGWVFERLNNIGEWGAGATPNRSRHEYYGGEIPWFKSGELVGDYISECEEFITDLALKESSLRFNSAGDVLIAMYGATIGKTSILNIPATTNQAVCACTPFSGIYNVFLLLLLKAYKSRFIGMGAGGAQPNISREKIIATVFGLPPLPEQHRIVSKVDELMSLCDKLEQQQTDHNALHETLVETLLTNLTSAAGEQESEEAWQRIAGNFDTLFITGYSIDKLKQSILQLAVMGRLVRQDKDDEPASELLKKIAKEKAQLIKEGKIKKQSPLPAITDEEKPFELPDGWEWSYLQKIVTSLGDGLHGTPGYTINTKYYFINGNNLKNGKIEIKQDTKTVSYEEMLKYKKELNLNSILVSINGTLGNVAFYNGEEIMLGKSACYFNLVPPLSKYYIKLIIESPYFLEFAYRNATGSTIKNLGLKAMNELPVPLPPLSEQRRIVTKVDELFVVCDVLKERIGEAEGIVNLVAEAAARSLEREME